MRVAGREVPAARIYEGPMVQAIAEGILVPATTVRLAPGGRVRLVVVTTVDSKRLPVKLKKLDWTLSVRLVDFARDLQVRSSTA